jgi:hypothetical protein
MDLFNPFRVAPAGLGEALDAQVVQQEGAVRAEQQAPAAVAEHTVTAAGLHSAREARIAAAAREYVSGTAAWDLSSDLAYSLFGRSAA